MSDPQQQLIAEVRARFGESAAITDADAIAPSLTDWRGRYHGRSAAILAPGSTEEAAAIVALALDRRVRLVPQGGNTSMVGGATPLPDGSTLILSSRRLNRVRAISAEGLTAVAEAGVILAELHDRAAAVGCRFPLTLGSRGSCTIGGLVATNAGGTQVLRFGTMRALVAGIEAVLPDGSVIDGLSPLKKDNRGYDLSQLLIASEGTLGLITAVSLRLAPAVGERAVAWLGVASPEQALRVLRALEAATDRVEGFEIVPRDSLDLVLRHIPGTRPPLPRSHAWNVLVEATAIVADEAETPAGLLERLLAPSIDSGLIEDAVIAASESQAEALWRIRDSISEAERASGPSTQHDIAVAVDVMPRFMVEAAGAVHDRFPGTEASAFGHLGDGNVHFHVRAGARAAPDWVEREGPEVTRFVDDLVTAAGGTISAEHGIGQMKRDELARLTPPGRLAALKAIKAALDPTGLFNPGKLL